MNFFSYTLPFATVASTLCTCIKVQAQEIPQCHHANLTFDDICFIEKEIGLYSGLEDKQKMIYEVFITPDQGFYFINREEWIQNKVSGSYSKPQVQFVRSGSEIRSDHKSKTREKNTNKNEQDYNFQGQQKLDKYQLPTDEISFSSEASDVSSLNNKGEPHTDDSPVRNYDGTIKHSMRDKSDHNEKLQSKRWLKTNVDLIRIYATAKKKCVSWSRKQGCLSYENGILEGVVRLYQIKKVNNNDLKKNIN